MKPNDIQSRWLDVNFLDEKIKDFSHLFNEGGVFSPSENYDLKGFILGTDFASEYMHQKGFIKCEIHNCDFSKSIIGGKISGTRFYNCNFTKANFLESDFPDTKFIDCQFSSTAFKNPFFDDAEFIACSFNDVNFSGRKTKEDGGKRVRFLNVRFSNVNFNYLSLRSIYFEKCEFINTNSRNCIIIGAKLESCIGSPL